MPNDLKNSGNELVSLTEVAPGILERVVRCREQKTFRPGVDGDQLAEKTKQDTVNETWRYTTDYINAASGAQVPAPPKLLKERDPETGIILWTLQKIVPDGTEIPAFGSVMVGYPGHYVCEPTEERAIEDSPRKLHSITFCALPPGYVEYIDFSYNFPGIHTNGGYHYGTAQQEVGQLPPPYAVAPGTELNTFVTIYPRPARTTARRTVLFSLTPGGPLPPKYRVYTPGVSSRFFDIPPNTIHGPLQSWQLFYDGSGTETARLKVEDIPASTPSTYDSTDVLVAKAEKVKWKGAFYKKEVIQISEALDPHLFPPIFQIEGFTLAAQPTVVSQLLEPSRIVFNTMNAIGDFGEITIYGKRKGKAIKETLNLSETSKVMTTQVYDKWDQVYVPAHTSPVLGFAEGVKPSVTFLMTAQAMDGDELDFGSVVLIMKDVPTLPEHVGTNSDIKIQAQNLVDKINALTAFHADPPIKGSDDEDPNWYRVLASIDNPWNTTWAYSFTSITGIEVEYQYTEGYDGLFLFEVPGSVPSTYRSTSLRNDQLLFGDGTVDSNLPRGGGLVSNPLAIAPGPISLQLVAVGSPPITVTYETSNNGIAWTAGITPLPLLGNSKTFVIPLAETTKSYIRVTFANPSNARRQVHAAIRYDITV